MRFLACFLTVALATATAESPKQSTPVNPTNRRSRAALWTLALIFLALPAVPGIYAAAFTAFYLADPTPALLHLESTADAKQLFSTLRESYPTLLAEELRRLIAA